MKNLLWYKEQDTYEESENIYMENRKTNPERVKVERFFHKLWDKSLSKSVSWFLVGIFLFLIMIACMIPAQEIYTDIEEDGLTIVAGALTILSFMAAAMQTAQFKQYAENQKSRTMKELLQYYPISRKAVWELKIRTLLQFLIKVTVVGLLLQCIVTLIAYGEITWLNFFHIIMCVFLFPFVGELVFDSIMREFAEE